MDAIRPGDWIDLHVHCPVEDGEQAAAVARLLARLDRTGAARAVAMSLDARELGAGRQPWAVVRRVCAAAGGRLLPAVAFDPRELSDRSPAGVSAAVERCAAEGAVMFGEYVPNLAVDDPLNQAVFAACAAVGLPVTIHLATDLGRGSYGLYDDPGLPRLEAVLARFPDLVLIGHSQAFWSEIAADGDPATRGGYPAGPVAPGRVPELMRRYRNLRADLSGRSGYNALARDTDHATAFLAEFADRLHYASDLFPVGGPAPLSATLLREFAAAGRIDAGVLAAVTRDNALTLLG